MNSASRHPLVQAAILVIAVVSSLSAYTGIYSSDGPGPYTYRSIRGQEVIIYGKGLYKDMSAAVAPQGIAQDVVTLYVAVPLLLISLLFFRRGSFKAKVALTGVLLYFLVTYLFYSVMGMLNQLFVAYILLMSLSFFSFIILLNDLQLIKWWHSIVQFPVKAVSMMLMGSSVLIGLLWLSIVYPSLFGLIPHEVEHYTTLIVQALDLAILLPASFICGYMLMKRRSKGYAFGSVYIVFLALLMTALSAKVIAMGILGENIIPVVFIIPTLNMLAVILAIRVISRIPKVPPTSRNKNIGRIDSSLARDSR